MTIDEKLEELRKELARQDAELAAAYKTLEDAPANVMGAVPLELLQELEEAAAARAPSPVSPLVVGIRV